MPSPFPGMDPYLERHWLDVHTKLVTYATDELNRRLPADLIARAEERMAIEAAPDISNSTQSSGGSRENLAPDVRLFEAVSETQAATETSSAGGVALAPYRLVLQGERLTERFIEIIDPLGGERLITVIEFVSPTNKKSKGLEAFARKRESLLSGGVNFVEIDLVRAGDWQALLQPHVCPSRALSAYRAVIRVASEPLAAYLQPIPMREPLPVLRIPLRSQDPRPIELPLQPMLEAAYQNGRYERTLDYRLPCDPPLEPADAEWADQLLRASGRR